MAIPVRRAADCELPRQYPQHDVADHEVFMAFNGDDDAIAFREWWDSIGSGAFAKWLEKDKSKRGIR